MLNYRYTVNRQAKTTLNKRGVITIPVELRRAFGLKPDDELILDETSQGILIRPSFSVPIELYSDERIAEFTADEAAIAKRLPPNKPKR